MQNSMSLTGGGRSLFCLREKGKARQLALRALLSCRVSAPQRSAERLHQFRYCREQIRLEPVVGHREDRASGSLLMDDDLGVLHAGQVLDRPLMPAAM